jgi:hypothetical protein
MKKSITDIKQQIPRNIGWKKLKYFKTGSLQLPASGKFSAPFAAGYYKVIRAATVITGG